MRPRPAALAAVLACAALRVLPAPARAQELGVVEPAIARGVDWLVQHQMRDGSWPYEYRRFRNGQTALSAYALLKSGVPPTHPAIVRALRYLDQVLPTETYACACELLAREALPGSSQRGRMQAALANLLDYEQNGLWSYPLTWSEPGWTQKPCRPDLSNMHYASIGLRAAHQAGLAVPREALSRLLKSAQRFQAEEEWLEGRPVMGSVGGGRQRGAGFRYVEQKGWAPSASMSAAGAVILGVCQELLGETAGPGQADDLQRCSRNALNWLGYHFQVEDPAAYGSWFFYWLYSIERIGALYGLRELGAHDWYAEGARKLLEIQAVNGSWAQADGEPDTCFALLFLGRATRKVATGIERAPVGNVYASNGPSDDFVLRGAGRPVISLVIGEVRPEILAEHAQGPGGGLRVAQVEFLVGGKIVASLAGDPARPWTDQRYSVRHEFKQPGVQRVSARLRVLAADAPVDAREGTLLLESSGFAIDPGPLLFDWMLPAAEAAGRNRLAGVEHKASSSSVWAAADGPAQAFDNSQATRWLTSKDDKDAWLALELERDVKADRIVLSQAATREFQRGAHDRITQVELRLNRDAKLLLVDLDPNELAPTVYLLGRPVQVRQLKLRVTQRAKGGAYAGLVGFAEVALELTEQGAAQR